MPSNPEPSRLLALSSKMETCSALCCTLSPQYLSRYSVYFWMGIPNSLRQRQSLKLKRQCHHHTHRLANCILKLFIGVAKCLAWQSSVILQVLMLISVNLEQGDLIWEWLTASADGNRSAPGSYSQDWQHYCFWYSSSMFSSLNLSPVCIFSVQWPVQVLANLFVNLNTAVNIGVAQYSTISKLLWGCHMREVIGKSKIQCDNSYE